MEYQRNWSWFSSVWPLILGLFVLREIQAAHHRHVGQCIAVGTYNSLLELSAISFMDDVEILYYTKECQQIIVKKPWVSKALGVDYITKINHLLVDHEPDIQWIIRILSKNDNNRNRNHTVQFVIDCEIDNDVELKSHFHMIWDGEEIYRIDEGIGHWESLKPEVKKYRSFWESPLWTDIRKHYMNEYCVDLLRKIVGYSNLRNNVPEKPTLEKPWVLTLSIMLAVILLMSCAGAFILWKKRKSSVHVMRER